MKNILPILTLLLLVSINIRAEETMKCEIGPLVSEIGGSKWFINSCSDKKTVVIYSYPESPASPFYFMFYLKDGKYHLYGEGTGDKKYTKAASEELEKYSDEEIHNLIIKTKYIYDNSKK